MRAKTAALAAGWDFRASGVQLNRFCASGLEAVNLAAQKVRSDWEDLVVAGGVEFSLICIDIDHFKRCNDTYGHDVGDMVLRHTARILSKQVRAGETVCRLGGEEFLILLPSAQAEMATVAAERIRAAIETNRVKCGDLELSVTISIGVAERTGATPSPEDLLKLADQALYEAKRTGRNRVCLAGAPVAAAQNPVAAVAP